MKWISYQIFKVLKTSVFSEKIYNLLNDEINVKTSLETLVSDYELLLQILPVNFAQMVKIEVFQLKRIDKRCEFYVREAFTDLTNLDIKSGYFRCISSTFFAMAWKKYYGLPVHVNDRKFLFENQIATLDKSIFEDDPSEIKEQ